MTDEEKTPIMKSFRIQPPILKNDLVNNIYEYVENFIYESINCWDNFCIESLYKEYQKYGFTKVFVINREEFKKFILWALPLYEKEILEKK